MLTYLILLFTILPAIELMLLIKVGTHIGALNTVFLVIMTGIIGASLAKMQGMLTLQKIQESLNHGRMPNNELLDGFMIFAGGVLLLTPGFVTDIMGILLLLPPIRFILKKLLRTKFTHMMHDQNTVIMTSSRGRRINPTDDDIIDIG